MTRAPFDLKRWLDGNVVPLLGGEPALELHSVLTNRSTDPGRPDVVLAWALSKTGTDWAPTLKRLLDGDGFSFDFTRAPQLVTVAPGKTLTLFGGDGMPFVGKNGMAMARLYRRCDDGVDLILEIGHRFEKGQAAIAAVRAFFEQFAEDPTALLAKHSPPFGAA